MRSRPRRLLTAALAALRSGLALLLAAAGLGGLLGLGVGLATEPEYAATATVLIVDRGEPVDLVGSGAVGSSGPEGTERLLELARSEEVAELAAASLGGDLAGADLVATTEFRGGDRGGTLVVRSVAQSPDLAAAAANAFAGSVIEISTIFERRRLRAAENRLAESIADLDPASDEALALTARLEATKALATLGPPMRAGREAEIPIDAEPGREPARTTAAGAVAGALLAALFLLAREARRRPLRRPEQLARLLGVPVTDLGPELPGSNASAPAQIEVDELDRDRMHVLAHDLGLDDASEARTLALASPLPDEGRTTVALGLAAALAQRGVSVLLVETDMRAPTLARRLRLGARLGLANYLRGEAGPRQVIHTIAVAGGPAALEPPGFVCVTAGTGLIDSTELLASPRFGGLVDQLRRVYDVVLFDTPAALPSADAEIVCRRVDATVIVARAGQSRAEHVEDAVVRLSDTDLRRGVFIGAPHLAGAIRRLRPRSPVRYGPELAGKGEAPRAARRRGR